MTNTLEPDFFSTQVAQARRFYLQTSAGPDTRIKVVCGGCEHTRSDFEINRPDFPYYCIEFVAKGAGTVTLNGHTYALTPGTLFYYGPGISQHIQPSTESLVKYFVDFTGTSAKQILKKGRCSLGVASQVNRPDEMITLLDQLIAHGMSDSPYKAMLCATLLEYLLYRMADLTTGEKENPSRAFQTYQHCRWHIRDHFITLLSLDHIAQDCSIDPAYLCRLFKRYDTQTPYQYLQNLKMTYAADRFQLSDVLVKEVAHELGFTDPFHFTRVFKNVFGTSPQTFKGLR